MMPNADKVVDYVITVLTSFIPEPVKAIAAPAVKPLVGDKVKTWLGDSQTKEALLSAASKAEADFRKQSEERFGDHRLSEAVISLPLYNGEMFQAALQSLPAHYNESILEKHLADDLLKNWKGEFSADEIRAATALYLECLRLRLLKVNGYAEIVTRLAILRTDLRTEEIQKILNQLNEKVSELLAQIAPSQPSLEIGGGVDRSTIIMGNNNTVQNIIQAQFASPSLHQLPQPPADFTGRETYIAELLQDFDNPKGGIITGLTGMGGIGKTALGLAVTNQIKDKYHDAQIYLDLKGTTAPLSAADIMRHVILSFEPTKDLHSLDDAGLSASYQSVVHDKRVLLFLDNARSADQIASLRLPKICALFVTSRWMIKIPGLKLHRVDALSEDDAKTFMLEICPRINDKAAELAKACAFLPLALRIAGSFLAVNDDWKVEKYLTQFVDSRKRLATLHENRTDAELTTEPDVVASFELSYNQLDMEDQKHWRMLGVLTDSFASGAAQALWEMGEDDTRKLLGMFKRYSLLDYKETSERYDLHDLLADYAISQMHNGEEKEAHIKHAFYYMKVMGDADALYLEGDEKTIQGLRLLDSEWSHVRSAQAWITNNIEQAKQIADIAMRYPSAATYCLDLRLLPKQKIEWLKIALKTAQDLKNKEFEGIHLNNLGLAYADLGDFHTAIEYYEKRLVSAREIKNRRAEGIALSNLGNAYKNLGEVRKAIQFYEKALDIARKIRERLDEGNALGNLGNAYINLGETDKAIELCKQTLFIMREIKALRGEGVALGSIGLAHKGLGEVRKAIQFYEEALDIARKIGDGQNENEWLTRLGQAHEDLGEVRKAIEFYEQLLIIYGEIGDRRREGNILGKLGSVYAGLGDSNKAIKYYEQALIIDRENGDHREEAIDSWNLGEVYEKIGELDKAIKAMQICVDFERENDDPDANKDAEVIEELMKKL